MPIEEAFIAPVPTNTHSFSVHLDRKAYTVAQATFLALHIVCGAFNFAAARFFLKTQDMMMTFRFELVKVILPPRFFAIVALAHYAVCSIHCYLLISPAIFSVYRHLRRCMESSRSSGVLSSRESTGSLLTVRLASRGAVFLRFASTLPQTIERRIPQRLRTTSRLAYSHIFGRFGLFGIQSQHFDAMFLAREVIQTGFQTYQAYQMCRLLTRYSLNRVFVGMLVANCWITPILHRTRMRKPLRRVLDLLFDIALNLMASIGVPVALVWTYWPYFNRTVGDFPADLWMDFIWSTRAFSEAPLVFFGSWMDVACRFATSIGLVLSLDDVKLLLRRKSHRAVHPQGPEAHAVLGAKPTAYLPVVLGHRAMSVYGAVVLGIHLQSELRPWMSMCLMELRPWLTTQTFCSVLEFSCFRERAFSGVAHEFDAVFSKLDTLTLVSANFRHCRSVQIQRSIQRFPNVTYISFYNSTISSWEEDAAVTEIHTPKLMSMDFVRANFSRGLLPPGITSRETPRRVFMLRFSITNLMSLPDDLDERWPPRVFLVIDFSQLTEFPLALTRTSPLGLVLAANSISTMPTEAFEVPGLYYLSLKANPISLLPSDVQANASDLYTIQLDSTNLSVVPEWLSWLASDASRSVSAGRTPYCDRMQLATAAGNASQSPIGCRDAGPVVSWFQQDLAPRADEVW